MILQSDFYLYSIYYIIYTIQYTLYDILSTFYFINIADKEYSVTELNLGFDFEFES